MTSYDRHATPDSPYRTGRHVPLDGSRHAPLTSITTAGLESRPDLTDVDDGGTLGSASSLHRGFLSPLGAPSPNSPYPPAMRSSSAVGRTRPTDGSSAAPSSSAAPGEIQLQDFHDGRPPPPPVAHSWTRIDRWAEDNYAELYDQLAEGATNNDLNELEYMLDCSLPTDVRESWQIHDGQERGGMPTGILFGCMLLDCEEIVQEWQQWRKVNQEYLSDHVRVRSPPLTKPVRAGPSVTVPSLSPPPSSSSSSSSSSTSTAPAKSSAVRQPNPLWRQELLSKQDSQPASAVRKAYAHPGWIPLARDWGGNNIAVDLAPGPAGTWGQVIIFGRDFDRKYLVARSWSAFLATVADDLQADRWAVDEETQELRHKEFATATVEPTYLDTLRRRADLKYGKSGSTRKTAPTAVNVPASRSGGGGGGGIGAADHHGLSPRASPVMAEFDRGRSMHRFGAGASVGGPPGMSPKSRLGRSSPLAKVSEEIHAALPTHTGIGSVLEPGRTIVDGPTAALPFDVVPDPSTADGGEIQSPKSNETLVAKGSDGEINRDRSDQEGKMKTVEL